MNYLPHQQRVIDERTELIEKTTNLSEFIETDLFKSLVADEQERLKRQYAIMMDYCQVLTERIEAFMVVL